MFFLVFTHLPVRGWCEAINSEAESCVNEQAYPRYLAMRCKAKAPEVSSRERRGTAAELCAWTSACTVEVSCRGRLDTSTEVRTRTCAPEVFVANGLTRMMPQVSCRERWDTIGRAACGYERACNKYLSASGGTYRPKYVW